MSATDGFFAGLPDLSRFQDVTDRRRYTSAPDDWCVVITDVVGSTKAIEEGRYRHVNALGVASIVALRNAVPDVDLPFVFGGDGATLLCPEGYLPGVCPALRELQRRARDAFDLELRAGIVPIRALREAGHDVGVARYRASPHAVFAMLSGSGVAQAETWVKGPEGERWAVETKGESRASFEGFECRWEPIASRHGVILSLLVQARAANADAAAVTYTRVVEALERIAGRDAAPAREDVLALAARPASFDTEARLKSGAPQGPAHWRKRTQAQLATAAGRKLMASKKDLGGFPGSRYARETSANSDYRKFDDTLRMVLDLSEDQRRGVEAFLQDEHEAGTLAFGLHVAPAALMTCMITSYEADHLHFLDGAEGGYALAAKQLKRQLRAFSG
ncbi:MAG: DUF3095 domain-containing protein [Myxococcota bacterium]